MITLGSMLMIPKQDALSPHSRHGTRTRQSPLRSLSLFATTSLSLCSLIPGSWTSTSERSSRLRAMRRFSKALAAIPGVFVGGTEEMKHTVSTTHDAARRCFRSRGLPVLPWRKNRFMQNKWLGPCHRTARDISIGFSGGVSCRVVEFDDVVSEAGCGGGNDIVVRR
ncbi:hypothetical protein GmHk_18G052811 [Glycine max]|nr:hypothetical protein GmHk_18G052811 [Glycine max]